MMRCMISLMRCNMCMMNNMQVLQHWFAANLTFFLALEHESATVRVGLLKILQVYKFTILHFTVNSVKIES